MFQKCPVLFGDLRLLRCFANAWAVNVSEPPDITLSVSLPEEGKSREARYFPAQTWFRSGVHLTVPCPPVRNETRVYTEL